MKQELTLILLTILGLPQAHFATANDTALFQVLNAVKDDIDNKILLYKTPSNQWEPSTVYRYDDLLESLEAMSTDGIAGKFFYTGENSVKNGHAYGLINLAAFLAQSMKETIQYDACDENSWDLIGNSYPLSNGCGQLNQSYQDYHCSDEEKHMECPLDPTMSIKAVTNAKWYGAPGPLFCGPKSEYPSTGIWDHIYECNKPWADPPELCSDYEGQKAGRYDNSAPFANAAGRTDVENCCWWGRGVIQTSGVCNFGKLNYYLGARAAEEGRQARYPTIDFCKDPEAICSSTEFKELKWIAGMFYWMESVQSYNADGWDYLTELRKFVDGGMTGSGFIDAVSGIVNRGCHDAPCATGAVDGVWERSDNFKKVLDVFFENGPDPQPQPQEVPNNQSQETANTAPATSAPIVSETAIVESMANPHELEVPSSQEQSYLGAQVDAEQVATSPQEADAIDEEIDTTSTHSPEGNIFSSSYPESNSETETAVEDATASSNEAEETEEDTETPLALSPATSSESEGSSTLPAPSDTSNFAEQTLFSEPQPVHGEQKAPALHWYRCNDDVDPLLDAAITDINFRYNVLVSHPDAVQLGVLAHLENEVIKDIASALDCKVSSGRFLEEAIAGLVGFQASGNILIAEKRDSCGEAANNERPVICVPVVGKLYAWVKSDTSEQVVSSIKNSILSVIQNEMNNDKYTAGYISSVVFEGEEMMAPNQGNFQKSGRSIGQPQSSSSVWIPILCGILAFIFSGLAVLYVTNHKDKVVPDLEIKGTFHNSVNFSSHSRHNHDSDADTNDNRSGHGSETRSASSASSFSGNGDDGPFEDFNCNDGNYIFDSRSNGGVNFIMVSTPEDV